MKKIILTVAIAIAISGVLFAGGANEKKEAVKSDGVLEFYHAYYHSEQEWPPAKVMRDIYDEFAKRNANGPVQFKPIVVENVNEIAKAQVAGGKFPEMIDLQETVSASAIAQGLVLDVKPFIDKNGLQKAVGINYTENNVNGKIYSVHDQLEARGLWYNADVLKKAGVSVSDLATWDGFAKAMEKVRALKDGSYGYIAGQGSVYMLNAHLAQSANGRKLIASPISEEVINSKEFADSFKYIAALDKANGSAHTAADIGNMMGDFNSKGVVAVLGNGVWNAGSIDAKLAGKLLPTIYPGNVSLSSSNLYGLTISGKLSPEEEALALEFLKYMVSPEVQQKIFLSVQANPCNSTLDLNALAKTSNDKNVAVLADACSQVNKAKVVAGSIYASWGADVINAITNALMECTTSSTDINARFATLQKELIALIN